MGHFVIIIKQILLTMDPFAAIAAGIKPPPKARTIKTVFIVSGILISFDNAILLHTDSKQSSRDDTSTEGAITNVFVS